MIFERLATYRIKRTVMDALALKLHFSTKWSVDRVALLDEAHLEFQNAVQEYEARTLWPCCSMLIWQILILSVRVFQREAKEHSERVRNTVGKGADHPTVSSCEMGTS